MRWKIEQNILLHYTFCTLLRPGWEIDDWRSHSRAWKCRKRSENLLHIFRWPLVSRGGEDGWFRSQLKRKKKVKDDGKKIRVRKIGEKNVVKLNIVKLLFSVHIQLCNSRISISFTARRWFLYLIISRNKQFPRRIGNLQTMAKV